MSPDGKGKILLNGCLNWPGSEPGANFVSRQLLWATCGAFVFFRTHLLVNLNFTHKQTNSTQFCFDRKMIVKCLTYYWHFW